MECADAAEKTAPFERNARTHVRGYANARSRWRQSALKSPYSRALRRGKPNAGAPTNACSGMIVIVGRQVPAVIFFAV
jgi:hypothetical protein